MERTAATALCRSWCAASPGALLQTRWASSRPPPLAAGKPARRENRTTGTGNAAVPDAGWKFPKASQRILHVSGPVQLRDLDKLMGLREELQPDAFVISGGLIGTGKSLADRGATMVAALNIIGVTHVSLGGVDFLFGEETLGARIAEFKGTVLCSNLEAADVASGSPMSSVVPVSRRVAGACSFTGFASVSSDRYVLSDGRETSGEVLTEKPTELMFVMTSQPIEKDESLVEIAVPKFEGSRIALILGSGEREATIVRTPCGIRAMHTGSESLEFGDIEVYDEKQISVVCRTRPFSNVVKVFRNESLMTLLSSHLETCISKLAEAELPTLSVPLTKRSSNPPAAAEGGQAPPEDHSVSSYVTFKRKVAEAIKDILEVDYCIIHDGSFASRVEGGAEVFERVTLDVVKEVLPYPTQIAVIRVEGELLESILSYTAPPRGSNLAPDTAERTLIMNLTARDPVHGKSYLVALPRLLLSGLYSMPYVKRALGERDASTFPAAPAADLLAIAAADSLRCNSA